MQTKAFRVTAWLLAAGFFLLLGRLAWLNAWRGADFVAMAQNQRLSTTSEYEFSRGDFLDRHGEALTGRAERVLLVFPALLSPTDRLHLPALLDELEIAPAPTLAANLQADSPFAAARNLSERQYAALQAKISGKDGLFCTVYHPRYAENAPAAHLIGYVGQSTPNEAAALSKVNSADTAYIGKSGLEYQYDGLLRGRACAKLAVACDEQGRQVGSGLRLIPSTAENTALNVRLTIDYSYQQILESAMSDKNGAAVLLDVTNGDVLAMCSSPDYDPNIGQPQIDGDNYLNKALCYYPPASVFKLVLAAAALEEGISLGDSDFTCSGQVAVNDEHIVHCWKASGHGAEDLSTAIANSCNPYFITLGQRLGGELIREYAWRLGLTEQVLRGVKVNSTNMLAFNSSVAGDVANVSIGEKGIRATPLMLARLLAAIAADGLLPEPRLVIALEDESGSARQTVSSATPRRVISPQTARAIRDMLVNAVNNGTGKPAASSIIGIGGKTGTSQNFGVWFACFFPTDTPRWAMAVYIADGSSGGSDAGSVCREVAEKLALLENIANTDSV